MPRFHFHVHDGAAFPDQNVNDLPDVEAARRQAIHLAGALLQDQALGCTPVRPLCVEVADDKGHVMLSVAITLTYRSSPDVRQLL